MNKLRLHFSESEINKVLNNPRYLWLLTVTIELIYLFPLLFLGENARVTVYDNLDIVIPLNKMLADTGMMFAASDVIVPNIMGGMPRFLFGSELNVYAMLFVFFKPFTAYMINEVLMHLLGLFSMIIFLRRYIVPSVIENRNLIIFAVSILFSLIPYYAVSGVYLLPLALFAFLNILDGDKQWWNWVIIVLVPFYSSLILVYFFFLLVMTVVFIVDFIRKKHINFYFLFALSLMSIVFLIVEHHLVYATFFAKGFVSHRTEFSMLQLHTFLESYRSAHQDFLNGLKNMVMLASGRIIPLMIFTMFLTLIHSKVKVFYSLLLISIFFISLFFPHYWELVTGQKYSLPILTIFSALMFIRYKQFRIFYGLLLLQVFMSYWYGFWFYEGIGHLAQDIHILKEFNFSRMAYLQPVLWYMILASAFVIIVEKLRFNSLLIIGILFAQSVIYFQSATFSFPKDALTFKSYYAQKLFDEIKSYIGKDPSQYRVGSLMMHPAIALYNGFYTIDGYLPNYPLSYKHRFYKIIQESLDEQFNEGNKELFEKWGSKCYLFDGNEPYLLYRPDKKLYTLSLDFRAFYNMGGRYLISSHELNASLLGNGLGFLKHFEDNTTYWNIYLYKVDRPEKK